MKIDGVTFSLAKYLWAQIITGKMKGGQKLNEIELASRMEISRAPLREAFRKLEFEKLVVSIPRKGTYVSEVSIEDCEELFHVRKVLELSALDCLKRNNVKVLSNVEDAVDSTIRLEKRLSLEQEDDNMINYYKSMAAFHENLVESSRNRWLVHSYESLKGNLARYQIMYLNLSGSYEKSIGDHLNIIQMIKEGDFNSAKKTLKDHIEDTAKRIEKRMLFSNK